MVSSVSSDVITHLKKGPILFAGIPSVRESEHLENHKKTGGTVIYFMSPEEKTKYVLGEQEMGVVWGCDANVKQFLFENIMGWMGGQIGNGVLDGGVGCTTENMARGQHLASILQEVIALWNFDTQSAKHLFKENLPYRNMLRNHRWVEDGVPFQAMKGRGKGIVTVLIAAGPSLDSQWEDLANLRKRIPNVGFICCGRSFKQAMKYGLNPEFVQEVEQFEWDDRLFLFAPEPPPSSVLIMPLTACANLAHCWPNRGQVCVTFDHNYAQIMGMKVGEDSMDGGNSIIHHMMNFAFWLGSDIICVAGADLAYPPGHTFTHAVGTFHQWSAAVHKQEMQYQDTLMVPSTDGQMVRSSSPYRNFAVYMEISIQKARKANPSLRVVNFCPNGQKIEGAEYGDVKTWSPIPSSSPLLSFQPPSSAPLGSLVISGRNGDLEKSLSEGAMKPSSTATNEAAKSGNA